MDALIMSRLIESRSLVLDLRSGLDRIKSIERKIVRKVEISASAAGQKKPDIALREAKEAFEMLDVLRVAILKEQTRPNSATSSPSDQDDHKVQSHTQPMTTGVNLFDLSIMVKCNLAAQLKNNGQLEGSLDLYTQLCKMAIDQTGSSSSSFMSDSNGNQQQQHQQSRYLLYRFGLNIGNVLCEMKEYQRALKYYRLTLDRLSSQSGNRSLQIKLMNNITIALMTMNGVARDELSEQQQDRQLKSMLTSSSSKTNDHVTSLQLLLDDNSFAVDETQRLKEQQQTATNQVTSASQGSKSFVPHFNGRQVFNSNHHKFGLNLIVCQWANSDLSAMYTTLKSLTKVDICRQYKRVLSFHSECTKLSLDDVEKQHLHNKSSWPEIDEQNHHENKQLSFKTSAHATSGSTLKFVGEVSQGNDLETGDGDSKSTSSTIKSIQYLEGKQLATTQVNTNTSNERARRVMSAAHADNLESLIRDKEEEIHRALIISCSLITELDDELRRRFDHKQQHQQQQQKQNPKLAVSQSASSSSGLERNIDNLDDVEYDERAGTAKRGGPQASSKIATFETPVSSQCAKLLAQSDLYESLADDLKANSVAKLLPLKGKLLKVMYVLERIGSKQRVGAGSAPSSSNSTAGISSSKALRGKVISTSSLTTESESTLVAVNLGLLHLLRNQIQTALELNRKALLSNKFNVECLINIANCHFKLSELIKAEEIYAVASKVNPRAWTTHFNQLLLGVKLGRHLDDLDLNMRESIKESAQNQVGALQSTLLRMQLAILYHQSGLTQKSFTIFDQLLNTGLRQAPELYLRASRLLDERMEGDDHRDDRCRGAQSAISIIQVAHRIHPYHVPTAERLIALYINNFDYKNAISILIGCCIKNRPEQVRWYQMLAECHRRAADYNEAIAIYKHATEIFPMDDGCLKALLKLSDELGLTEVKAVCQTRLQNLLSLKG